MVGISDGPTAWILRDRSWEQHLSFEPSGFLMVKLNRLVFEDYSELEARIKTRDSGDTVQQACKTVLQSSPCAKSYLEKPLSSLFFPATVRT